MIQLEQIKNFFPPYMEEEHTYQKYMLKEYIQLLILDYLATTVFIRKIVLIGGTNLRLVKGIDRFSEDLDFDCKDFTRENFSGMTDGILLFLHRFGLHAETRDRSNERLTAFRRNIYFPEFLFDLGLSVYKDERFLIKVECQDQQVDYKREVTKIKGCGLFFPFPVPVTPVLCAMKISALLSRQKGRDFYDVIFLLEQTSPDFSFLSSRCGIHNLKELKMAVAKMLETVDLSKKAKDFEHLLFHKENSNRILSFGEFIAEL